MKISLLLAALLLAPHAVADEAADRAAIESIVASLNDRDEPSADLFTAEAKAAGETSRLSQLRRIILAPRRPWSEVSEPRLAVKSIHLVTPEIAMVEAQIGQYGMTSWSAPVVLLMKKESRWRIAVIRVYLSPYGQRIRTHGDWVIWQAMRDGKWVRLLAYVTGSVNQELLLQNEYLAAENRILRTKLAERVRLTSCFRPGVRI